MISKIYFVLVTDFFFLYFLGSQVLIEEMVSCLSKYGLQDIASCA